MNVKTVSWTPGLN